MNEFIKNMRTPNSESLFGQIWESVSFELALKFAVLYICIIWIAIVVWVIKDITNRTTSILLQVFCILLVVLLPFMWVFLYLLIRPGNTLLEKYYWEVEENLDTIAEFIQHQTSMKKQQEADKKNTKKTEQKYESKSEKKKKKKALKN